MLKPVTLDEREWVQIVNMLSKQPFRRVAMLILQIQQQTSQPPPPPQPAPHVYAEPELEGVN